jgi:hypothetical protein
VTVIPAWPFVIVIQVVRTAAKPGVTESDVFRWIGVAVAVAGVVLATPDGSAAAWLLVKGWVKGWSRRAWTFGRRLLGRPGSVTSGTAVLAGSGTTTGRARGYKWQPWREDARADVKIDILHRQVDLLLEQISELHSLLDRIGDGLRKEVREAEGRATDQVRQLAAELRGERSRASRVDARGFGPIALGIILTGLPDELAATADGWLGWLTVAVAAIWIASVSRSWLRDYRQALENNRN